jgi:hypothetical protein
MTFQAKLHICGCHALLVASIDKKAKHRFYMAVLLLYSLQKTAITVCTCVKILHCEKCVFSEISNSRKMESLTVPL